MALAAPDQTLEEELRTSLAKEGNRYIYKDLPRLALRTTVWAKSEPPTTRDLRSSGPRLFVVGGDDCEEEVGGGLELPPGTDLERSQEFSEERLTMSSESNSPVSLRLSDMLEVEATAGKEGTGIGRPVIRLDGSIDEEEETVDDLLDTILDSWNSSTAEERIDAARLVFEDAMIFTESDLSLLGDSDWADLREQGIPLGLKNKLCKLLDLRKAARATLGNSIGGGNAEASSKKEAKEERGEEVEKDRKDLVEEDTLKAPATKGRKRSRSNPLAASHETITMLDGTQMRTTTKKGARAVRSALKRNRAPKLRQGAMVNVTSLMPDEEKAGYLQLCEIERVVTSVAKALEAPPLYYRILSEFHDLKQQGHNEMEMLLEELFTKTIGLKSKTTLLLKAMQQGLIMAATFHIKYHVTKDIMTRDVKGREGWQIVINISDTVVTVTHMRREQALASVGVENYFWFEWHLTMTFDRKTCSVLHSCSLRIVDLWTST
eukprot:CAMPEP_0114625836 /NCGR_PEP_ID=MMETSP0168-20121206/11470_1 /TAXON_ID=95228 ORGANISM="Vannella sp., Strain DIVA3 517/6/12" /NCGR_SAMPLE_ID=MMETSP0168 /ASSEMBLY_ACC=CAM_ASM_000044 /LENGTH=490 /DNA_ID=CAMNT_0001837119 /DNA_START=32 /DNA_END=1501 /DNA_ORIENTATION=+